MSKSVTVLWQILKKMNELDIEAPEVYMDINESVWMEWYHVEGSIVSIHIQGNKLSWAGVINRRIAGNGTTIEGALEIVKKLNKEKTNATS